METLNNINKLKLLDGKNTIESKYDFDSKYTTKFNSLFDNDSESYEHYDVRDIDTIMGLTELVLNYDTQTLENNEKLFERNIFNMQNPILSGRPCSTSLCSSDKFCDSSGWPQKIKGVANVNNISDEISKNIDTSSKLIHDTYKNHCPPSGLSGETNRPFNKPNGFCNNTTDRKFLFNEPSKRINSEKW